MKNKKQFKKFNLIFFIILCFFLILNISEYKVIAHASADYAIEKEYDVEHSVDAYEKSGRLYTHVVVIDPGHQSHGMSEKEQNGPGSSIMKAKVSGGTSGKSTGKMEYQLNLEIGLKLKDELKERGYMVIMTRESNDVSLSNIERAQVANEANADAFIRIHANGSDNAEVHGAMTICQTPNNPYNSEWYSQSRKLSDCILESYVDKTGCSKQYVWETDTMTGINWAEVPSTIIELGYMSNPTEDALMASDDYQKLMVEGIADGVDAFFK